MASAGESRFLRFAIQWASIALLYYDYFLMFPREVKYIWRGNKRSLLILLYVLCRYALLANVLYLLAISGKLGDGESCDITYKIIGAISVLGRAAVIFTFLVRVYVICARNKIILGWMGVIAVTCIVLDILHVPGLRCESSNSIKIVTPLLAIILSVFELLVTAITLFQSIRNYRLFGQFPKSMNRETFSYIVAEQGILYFAIMSAFTIGGTVLNFSAPDAFSQRLLNAFTLPLSGMLTARFLLRLRAYHSRSVGQDFTTTSLSVPEVSTITKTRIGDRSYFRPLLDEFKVESLSREVGETVERHAANGLGSITGDAGESSGCEDDHVLLSRAFIGDRPAPGKHV